MYERLVPLLASSVTFCTQVNPENSIAQAELDKVCLNAISSKGMFPTSNQYAHIAKCCHVDG